MTESTVEEVEMESVECPNCGGLTSLRETCTRCEHSGRILRPVRPGHETLSRIRQRAGQNDGSRYGDDPDNPRTGPRYDDPLWVGTEAP